MSYICDLYMIRRYNIYLVAFCALTSIILASCKPVTLAEGDRKFAKGEYFEAADIYKKVYRKTSPKKRDLRGEIAFKMGESYRLINMPIQANSAYANAERYQNSESTLALQYARSLHKVGNYQKAAEQYKIFLEKYPDNQFALNALKGIELAPVWKKNPTAYTVKKMDLFLSTRGGEFAPMLLPPDYNQVYFTSNRKESKGEKNSLITGVKNNDIYMSRKDERGNWMKPEVIESPINTDFDEGVTSFNADGSKMYYTFAPQDSTSNSYTSIYVSSRAAGAWGEGRIVPLSKDSMAVYAHPSITPSGDFLYFVSDLPKGYGGKDIWRAALVDGAVSYIENLGPEINTAGDEMFPYMRSDNTMYFSSDGHLGMGGLDIFIAKFDSKTGKWTVENMQSPINSQGDDFGITFEGDKERGFLSSNRNEGRGYDRIYSFEYPTSQLSVEGYIVDPDDEFIDNATIRIVGNNGTNTRTKGKANGTYTTEVAQGVNYVFLASKEGYLNSRMALNTDPVVKDSIYYVDFVLVPINKPVVLENIFFDFDQATLRPESKEALDGLIELLNINPNVTIELSAHTDRKGTDEYNDKLSQRRADTVVKYLVDRKIAADRLTSKGYGKRQPKNVTRSIIKRHDFLKEGEILNEEFIETLTPKQQEAADEVNRRIEFKVLSITYNLE